VVGPFSQSTSFLGSTLGDLFPIRIKIPSLYQAWNVDPFRPMRTWAVPLHTKSRAFLGEVREFPSALAIVLFFLRSNAARMSLMSSLETRSLRSFPLQSYDDTFFFFKRRFNRGVPPSFRVPPPWLSPQKTRADQQSLAFPAKLHRKAKVLSSLPLQESPSPLLSFFFAAYAFRIPFSYSLRGCFFFWYAAQKKPLLDGLLEREAPFFFPFFETFVPGAARCTLQRSGEGQGVFLFLNTHVVDGSSPFLFLRRCGASSRLTVKRGRTLSLLEHA